MEQLPEFDYLSELGGGQFGTVYLCRSHLTGELRAVKHIDLPSPTTVEEWRREAEALAACHNDHVVRIHHAAATSEGPVLVMDFLPGGNAENRWEPGGGPIGEVVRCLLDATWGLAHLHNEGLLHRDLKPANLLFDEAGNTVIGDFGLAGHASDEAPFEYLPHIPPEVLPAGEWTQQADIYALGVTGWASSVHHHTQRPETTCLRRCGPDRGRTATCGLIMCIPHCRGLSALQCTHSPIAVVNAGRKLTPWHRLKVDPGAGSLVTLRRRWAPSRGRGL